MSKANYGDRRACACCGQDIEFHGAKTGWTDRGGERFCSYAPDPDPYNRGHWIKLKRKKLHKPA